MGRHRKNDLELALPKHVYKKRGRFYYETKDRRWIPLGTDPSTIRDQVAILNGDARNAAYRCLNRVFSRAKERAKRRGKAFQLQWAEMLALWERSKGRCEVTGIPFQFEQRKNFSRRPYAPSLDRIDSTQSYEIDNCRLVCTAVNIAINEWGVTTFKEIARALHWNDSRIRNYRFGPKSTDSVRNVDIVSD